MGRNCVITCRFWVACHETCLLEQGASSDHSKLHFLFFWSPATEKQVTALVEFFSFLLCGLRTQLNYKRSSTSHFTFGPARVSSRCGAYGCIFFHGRDSKVKHRN